MKLTSHARRRATSPKPLELAIPAALVRAVEDAAQATGKANAALARLAAARQRTWKTEAPHGPLEFRLPAELTGAMEDLVEALRAASSALQSLEELLYVPLEVRNSALGLLGRGGTISSQLDLPAPRATGGGLRDVDSNLIAAPRALDLHVPVHGGSPSRGASGSPPRATEEENRLYPSTKAPFAFEVKGLPATKGSTRSFHCHRTGRLITKADAPRLKSWERSVAILAKVRMGAWGRKGFEGPVAVSLTFRLPRPLQHFINRDGKRLREGAPHLHDHYPDLDKLARAVLDALTRAEVWGDDGQVAELRARKEWAAPGEEPGVSIVVTTIGGGNDGR